MSDPVYRGTMETEHALLAGVVGVVFVGVVVAAVVPGTFDEDDRPSSVDVRLQEVDVEAGELTGATAEIVSVARIRSRTTVDDNVSVVVRAQSTRTGLLEDESTRELDRLEGGRETEVRVPVTVPRRGGYELDVVVYVEGERESERTVRVSGVEALKPEHMDSDVGFHEFFVLPPVEFSVASAGDTLDLDVTSYLSNEGDTSESVEVVVRARQAESNIVADTARTTASVPPTRTEAVELSLSVPDGYNYYLDAEIWSDGNVVETHRTVANFDPTRRIDANVTERDVELQVEEFAEDEETRRIREEREELQQQMDQASGEPDQPGFGAAAALIALLALAFVARRKGGERS